MSDDDDDDTIMEQVGGGEESEGWWDVQHHKERHVKKFGVRQHDITFRPSPAFVDRQQGNDLAATLNDLDRSLKGLVRRAMTESGLTTSERAAITLQSSKLDHPIRLSWMPVSNITDEVIENTFNRVVQSHKDFVIDEGVVVNVIAMEDQRGGGGRKKHVSARINVMENMKHDSNIMCPPMDSGDEMCLARCLTYGMIWHHRQDRHRIRNLRRLCDNLERWTCKAHSVCGSGSGTACGSGARRAGKVWDTPPPARVHDPRVHTGPSRPPVFQELSPGGNKSAECSAGEWSLHVHQERGTVLQQGLLL